MESKYEVPFLRAWFPRRPLVREEPRGNSSTEASATSCGSSLLSFRHPSRHTSSFPSPCPCAMPRASRVGASRRTPKRPVDRTWTAWTVGLFGPGSAAPSLAARRVFGRVYRPRVGRTTCGTRWNGTMATAGAHARLQQQLEEEISAFRGVQKGERKEEERWSRWRQKKPRWKGR